MVQNGGRGVDAEVEHLMYGKAAREWFNESTSTMEWDNTRRAEQERARDELKRLVGWLKGVFGRALFEYCFL